VERKLTAAGFRRVSQKGSHVKFLKKLANSTRTAIVPNHSEIKVGTLASIIRQAGLSADEFAEL
jgi:predicted RNA binding protein YcfA (HicA-like mRNA interferase family)